MSFSFGNPPATSAPTPTTTPASSFSFSNTTTPAPGGGGTSGVFGGSNLGASTGNKPLFPSNSGTAGAGATPGGSVFGGSGGGGSFTGGASKALFGGASTSLAPPATTSSAPQTTAAFPSGGVFGAPSAGTASGLKTTGGGLFGSQTPAKPTPLLSSTTPAGAPPANKPAVSSLFAPGASNTPATSSPFGATGTSTPAAGGMFGAKSASNTAPASGSASVFANASSAAPTSSGGVFGTQGPNPPAQPTSGSSSVFAGNPAAPTGGSMFGAAAGATPTTNTAAAPAISSASAPAGTGLFAGAAGATSITQAPATTGAPASTVAAPATTSLFGAKLADTTGSSAAPVSAPSAPASMFGANPAVSSAATSTLLGAPTTTAATSTPLFGASGPAATTSTPTSSGDAAKAGVVGATNPNLSKSVAPTSQLPRLKNKTMDEIITRWAADLSKYQKEFKEQATKVASWDRLLVENGEKIQKLYLQTFEAERASNEIERQLVNVESQQDELAQWLDRYENEVNDMFAKQMGSSTVGGEGNGAQLTGPDQERERTYKMAEKLTERLDEMGKDLGKMIKEVNDVSGTLNKGNKVDDPLSQIVRVLNGHLGQLQWVDTNATALQAKVLAAQKAASGMGGQFGAPESDAAESFYKSYVNRR